MPREGVSLERTFLQLIRKKDTNWIKMHKRRCNNGIEDKSKAHGDRSRGFK